MHLFGSLCANSCLCTYVVSVCLYVHMHLLGHCVLIGAYVLIRPMCASRWVCGYKVNVC